MIYKNILFSNLCFAFLSQIFERYQAKNKVGKFFIFWSQIFLMRSQDIFLLIERLFILLWLKSNIFFETPQDFVFTTA